MSLFPQEARLDVGNVRLEVPGDVRVVRHEDGLAGEALGRVLPREHLLDESLRLLHRRRR